MTGVCGLPEQPCIGHTAVVDQIHFSARTQPGSHSAVDHFPVFSLEMAGTLQLNTARVEIAEGIAAAKQGICGLACRSGMSEVGACVVVLPEQERNFNRGEIGNLNVESGSDNSKNLPGCIQHDQAMKSSFVATLCTDFTSSQ